MDCIMKGISLPDVENALDVFERSRGHHTLNILCYFYLDLLGLWISCEGEPTTVLTPLLLAKHARNPFLAKGRFETSFPEG